MAELIKIENSSGDDVSQMPSGPEQPEVADVQKPVEPVTESPKPLAFTIDFGERKSVDTNRFKNMFEKYQNRHRRNQSMSKVPSVKEKVPVQKPPSSAHFPRKATTDYHSEGYFSSDQDETSTSFLRQIKMLGLKSNVINATIKQPGKNDLTLPLQNTTAQKLDKFSPMNSFGRLPQEDLNDISSPEFDVTTPAETPGNAQKSVQFTSKRLTSFDEESVSPKILSRASENRILNNLSQNGEELIIIEPSEQYGAAECEKESYEIEDLDEQLSDSVSETGTYTIDADNYTEEQKARMSIDREIITSVPALSPAQRTHNFVESTLQYVSNSCKYVEEPPIEYTPSCKYTEEPVCRNNSLEKNIGATSFIIEDNGLLKQKILSPQDSLTQISIESNNETLKHTNLVKKVLNVDSPVVRRSKNTNTVIFASSKPPEVEEQYEIDTTGSFTSITTCGVFNRDEKTRQVKEISPKRRSSLTQSDIFVENINKVAPTKIPSPIHSLSRPRSRASLELPDDTDLYLKQTQNVISNLQARLNSEAESKIAQNFLKTKHVRHNSFDLTKNTTHLLNNKLENFQTKVFQHIEPTTKQVAIATRSPTHKLYNSPNNSPIKRSSSFSSRQISSYTNTNTASDVIYINTGAAPIVTAQRNSMRMSPNVEKKTSVHRSMSTASIKNHLVPLHRPVVNPEIYQQNHRSEPYGNISAYKQESESSSEDDGACYIESCSSGNEAFSSKKEQNNITNTRHNRAFSLRRARLDLENNSTNKCPNTPEMRRKFPTSEPAKNYPRSTSTDARKPQPDVKSRYMNIAPKSQQSPKISSNRDPTPVGKSILNNRPSSASTPCTQKTINVSPGAKSASISRTDSGRFSMRATTKTKPVASATKTSGKKGNRSNSTLTSREVEFQMWKRRKSYDPMKAAAEGKKKAEMNKKMQNNTNMMTQSYTQASQDYDSSPSHSSSVHRSQSFHGTGGLDNYISSDEDLTLSADDGEGITPPAPTPNIRSPERGHPQVKQAWCVKNTRY